MHFFQKIVTFAQPLRNDTHVGRRGQNNQDFFDRMRFKYRISVLDENMHSPGFCDHHDHFTNSSPESEWRSCLEHAEKIGLGSREYELIEM